MENKAETDYMETLEYTCGHKTKITTSYIPELVRGKNKTVKMKRPCYSCLQETANNKG